MCVCVCCGGINNRPLLLYFHSPNGQYRGQRAKHCNIMKREINSCYFYRPQFAVVSSHCQHELTFCSRADGHVRAVVRLAARGFHACKNISQTGTKVTKQLRLPFVMDAGANLYTRNTVVVMILNIVEQMGAKFAKLQKSKLWKPCSAT